MRHHRAVIAACLLVSLAAAILALDATYREEIAEWQQDFAADVRKGGWLALVNRVQLTEGPANVSSKTTMTTTGDVAFELEGHSVRLETFLDENHLFVMFLDATNGRETYDFNKAYNPYCSVNDGVTCPVIPATSRLDVRAVAGEKYVRSD